jgi:exosortase
MKLYEFLFPHSSCISVSQSLSDTEDVISSPNVTTVLKVSAYAISIAMLLGSFIWAYWPTLFNCIEAWNNEPDYSHGYLVPPLAACMLWFRRDKIPVAKPSGRLFGLLLIILIIPIRGFTAKYYLDPIDGWSILIWLTGAICFLGGWRLCWWSLPAVIFLGFMVPLPFRMERWVSLPLQGIATQVSGWILQLFGQAALVKGHTILLGDQHLEIEQACSGLRIFVGIGALAFAYIVFTRRAWWEKGILLLSVIPIAILANSSRIVATGLLYVYASGDVAKKFSHDAAGWVMIPLAAAMFGLVLIYMSRLTQEVEQLNVADVLQAKRG